MPDSLAPIAEIMVPMDFSECSINALNFAKRVALGSGARMHLLYVDDDPILIQKSTDQSYRDQHEDRMAMKFVPLMTREQREQFRVEMCVRCGTASHEISRFAKEKGIDLIVMGNVGRSKFSRALLGSVTSHVISHAPCPVLSVKP